MQVVKAPVCRRLGHAAAAASAFCRRVPELQAHSTSRYEHEPGASLQTSLACAENSHRQQSVHTNLETCQCHGQESTQGKWRGSHDGLVGDHAGLVGLRVRQDSPGEQATRCRSGPCNTEDNAALCNRTAQPFGSAQHSSVAGLYLGDVPPEAAVPPFSWGLYFGEVGLLEGDTKRLVVADAG